MLTPLLRLPIAVHGGLAVASIVWLQWIKGRLDASYAASNHPVDYITGQTGFSAELLKSYYATMADAGTLDIYVTTQLIDFGFILGIVGIGLFVCTLLARLSRAASFGRRTGILAGYALLTGGLCDAIENGWSFVLLANPAGFADWLALPYSAFAVAKFAAITIGMALVIMSLISAALGRATNRPKIG